MSLSPLKNLIFVDDQSRRVLAIKRSRELNFSFSLSEMQLYQIICDEPVSLANPFSYSFSPEAGFTELAEASGVEQNRLRLLQRKIESMFLVKTRILLAEQEIVKRYQEFDYSTLSDRAFRHAYNFLKEEQKFLLSESAHIFDEFRKKVEGTKTLLDLELLYRDMQSNVHIITMNDLELEVGHH